MLVSLVPNHLIGMGHEASTFISHNGGFSFIIVSVLFLELLRSWLLREEGAGAITL